METVNGSILPDSFFEGLSTLWGACAYVASAMVAAGFVFSVVRLPPEPVAYVRLFARVLLIGIATLFIREWLMRLNDIVTAFNSMLGVDPLTVDEKFVTFISGKDELNPNTTVWDVIWGTKSIGTAIAYALLWLFGWASWGTQYIVKLIGDILLVVGWSLSPIFLGFFMIRPMAGVALRYIIGLIALVCWPFGWSIAAVVTNSMLEAAANASLVPVVVPSSAVVAPALTVLLIGTWMIASSTLAPYVTTRVLLMGVNPAAAFAQGVGGAAQSALAGGFGAAATAASGGAAAGAVIAAAATSAIASGVESAARGGRPAQTAATVTNGMSGFYAAQSARRRVAAYEEGAAAFTSMAHSAKSLASLREEEASFYRESRRRKEREERGHAAQPHHDDPTRAALEIEARARR